MYEDEKELDIKYPDHMKNLKIFYRWETHYIICPNYWDLLRNKPVPDNEAITKYKDKIITLKEKRNIYERN